MTIPVQDYVILKVPRAVVGEVSMSLIAHQTILADETAALQQQMNANAALLTERDKKIDGLTKERDARQASFQIYYAVFAGLDDLLNFPPDSSSEIVIAAVRKLMQDKAELTTIRQQQEFKLKEALARIEILVNTPANPAPVPPLPPAPVVPGAIAATINKQRVANMAQFTITTGDDAPSDAEDNRTRDFMAMGGDMGFNAVRFFLPLVWLRKHEALLKINSPLCLTTFARAHGLTPILDTVDQWALKLSDAELKEAFDLARLLGYTVACFNDANQYRNFSKFPQGTLERLVKRVREVAPDFVLFASVTASAKVTDYKPLFDYVEFQSFGKITEFDDFLLLKCDWLCLDGQDSASPQYLEAMLALMLASGKDELSVYTVIDKGGTNWKNQPETVAIYKSFLSKWRAARTKITAQLTGLPGS